MCAVVEADDDTAADSDDGSTGGGRRDRGGSAKKTVAPLKIKINKKKKKRRGSDVRCREHFPSYISNVECDSELLSIILKAMVLFYFSVKTVVFSRPYRSIRTLACSP